MSADEQTYVDAEGQPTTLRALVRDEPEWAVGRIMHLEKQQRKGVVTPRFDYGEHHYACQLSNLLLTQADREMTRSLVYREVYGALISFHGHSNKLAETLAHQRILLSDLLHRHPEERDAIIPELCRGKGC